MKRAGASYSHAFVVDSLCCVSRSSLFTGQYPHQTGVRTNTSGARDAMPLGGYAAFEGYGNRERAFNVTLQGSGYTTGFVGKYLNEYEYVQGRALPPVPPGWSQFNVVFGSAYDGWDFDSTYVRQRPAARPAPRRAAALRADGGARPGLRRQRDRALRARSSSRRHRDGDAPYFLEVAPYAPHNRTQPQPYYPGDPVFPPTFRDRPAAAARATAGRWPAPSLTTRDLPGFGDDRRDNRPRKANGKRARAWNTRANPFRPAQSVADLRNRAMMAQSVDRTVRKILRTRRRQHLRRAHLRQRLPPRAERPRPRQGHGLRHRRARPAVRRGAGRRAGHARRADVQHRPRADLRGARRRRVAGVPLRGSRWCRPSATRPWCAATTSSSSTPPRR